jgi:hypothetical protein
VEAGGVGIFRGIENTQLIDFSRRQKRSTRQNCGKLDRIWNAGFFPFVKRNSDCRVKFVSELPTIHSEPCLSLPTAPFVDRECCDLVANP